jgi:hypothetical protein
LFEELWAEFGRAGWVEILPLSEKDKDRRTRISIENKLRQIPAMVDEISKNLYGNRKTSPLPLPFNNFRSKIIEAMRVWRTAICLYPRISESAKMGRR